MDLRALLRDPAASPSPAPSPAPAEEQTDRGGAQRFSARPRRDLRRSLWKNRGRGGEDGLAKGTRRAEFGARRDMRRMDTLAARRPGMEEAARDVGAETTKTRLARFRAERAARQARERAGKRPPFRVGVYKLDGKFPPPSTDKKKAGQIPFSVRTAASRGKKLEYITPGNRTFARKVMNKDVAQVPGKSPTSSQVPTEGSKPKLNLVSVAQKREGGARRTQRKTVRATGLTEKKQKEEKAAAADMATKQQELRPEEKDVAPGAPARRSVRASMRRTLASRAPTTSLAVVSEEGPGDREETTDEMPTVKEEEEKKQEEEEQVVAATPLRRSRRISGRQQCKKEVEDEEEEVPTAPARRRKSRRSSASQAKEEEQREALMAPPAAATPSRRSTRLAAKKAMREDVEDRSVEVKKRRSSARRSLAGKVKGDQDDKKTPTGPSSSSTSLTPALEAMKLNARARGANPFAARFDLAGGHAPKMDFFFGEQGPAAGADADANKDEGSAQEKGVFRFQATDAPLARDPEGFLTPSGRAATPSRRRRVSQFSGLLDPLRKDLIFGRGSTSEKRRARRRLTSGGGGGGSQGGSSSNSPASDWRADLVAGVPDDASSPLHKELCTLSQSLNQDGPNVGEKDFHEKILEIVGSSERKGRAFMKTSVLTAAADLATNLAGAFEKSVADEEGPHDAPYFRALLETEAAVLTALCTEWEAKLVDVSLAPLAEDAAERVRAAVGKTRLLCDRKGRMEQFRGLVDACEYRLGDRPTTTEDLQGFWDMVSVQVEDVKRMFEELEQLEKRGWVVPEESTENKKPQKKSKAKATLGIRKPKPEAPSRARSALRAMMAAGRREVKAARGKKTVEEEEASSAPTVLLDPGTPSGSVLRPVNRAVEKVFEGGFFTVRSPSRRSKENDEGGSGRAEEKLQLDD